MLVDPQTLLLFGLCCAISAGHLFTGLMGVTTGRRSSELNGLFAALTVCAAWTVFWLGIYKAFPLERILAVRFGSLLLSGYVGPLLLLFCWGLVRPARPLPRWSYALLVFGTPGSTASLYAYTHPEVVHDLLTTLHLGAPEYDPILSPLYMVHSFLSLGTALASVLLLLYNVVRNPVREVREQAAWMMLAAGTALSGVLFANVVPTLFTMRLGFVAPLSTLPALGIAYKALLSNRTLMARLTTQRDQLSRFVPAIVVQGSEIEVRLGGEEAEVAVLFSDLRDFTSLSEDLEPAELIELLNHYLGRMTEVIQAHGGFVDKYIGDAVLAVFGLHEQDKHPCQAAYEAALAMQVALRELNEAGLTPDLRMGIGIHFGNVVHGNVGSSDRMEYTVLGDTVNLASRVEGLTKTLGVGLAMTEQVAKHVGTRLEDLGEQPIRGRRGTIHAFGTPRPISTSHS